MRHYFAKASLLSVLAFLIAICLGSTATAGTLTLTVGAETDPTSPVSFTVAEGQTLTFQVIVSDTDFSKRLHIQGSNLPTGASFTPGGQGNPRSATFRWTPSSIQRGSYTGITFTGSERGHGGARTRATVNITVGDYNHTPVLRAPGDTTVNEGETLSFTLSALDQDVGDTITYAAGDLPEGAELDPTTGQFTWTPDFGQAGSYTVTFRVYDNGQPALGDSRQITITVGEVNRSPVVENPGFLTVKEGETLSFQVFAEDPDGDALTFNAENVPDGATFDPVNQIFSWSPASTQSGNYQVTFSATDGNATTSKTATISVNNVNRPPMLDHIGSQSIDAGATLTITVTGQDLDGNSVTYSAENLPIGATFTGQTFSWSPTDGQTGAYDITFKITDDGEPPASASEVVRIFVNPVGLLSFTVMYSSDGNGTITCTSPVNYGSSSTCLIVPAAGYRLGTLTDNGTDVKSLVSGSAYVISPVNGSHVIAGTFIPNAEPVYRFYNLLAGTHFYTIWEGEKDWIIQNLRHYRFEGAGFYAYTTQQPDTAPVYRFFNTMTGTHFYTIWEEEKDWIIQNLPVYRFEGAGYFGYPNE